MRSAALLLSMMALLAGCHGTDKTPDAPAKTADKQDADDNSPGVTLKKDAQLRAGIRVEPLAAKSLQPELIAYGRLEEDPAASFVVRAPMAGTIRASQWPTLGQTISTGFVFGQIEPRLSPAERVGLNTQLSNANSDLNASTASVAAAQSAFDRARTLNADNKNVADKVVEEAAARLAAEQAHQRAARENIQLLEASLQSIGRSGALPVAAEAPGDVVEMFAHPGETIEQGAAIVRLARFDHLLARIDIPVGTRLPGDKTPARIVPAGSEDQPPLTAMRVAVAATESHALGVSLLYRLTATRAGLRPGAAVTARFTLPGNAGEGVFIPRAAVVQQDGSFWVYIQTKDDRFARRPVPRDQPTAEGFIVASGFSPGDRIVVTGAQSLLSEEFKSRNEADTN